MPEQPPHANPEAAGPPPSPGADGNPAQPDTPRADAPPADAAPADARPADAPSTDAPCAEAPPADARLADAPPMDVTPADAQPTDAPRAEALPGDARLADAPPADAPPRSGAAQPTKPSSTPPSPRTKAKSRTGRDRARRRAVRAHAAQTGVAYSIAARQLAAAALAPGETLANTGRTVYPTALSPGRWTILSRELRTPADKLAATRIAARIPTGRARHLTDRFPPAEAAGHLFYSGDLRPELLAMVYLAVAHEYPGLIPSPLDLAWTAELGEETAVDTTCADLDKAARTLLCDHPAARWNRIDAALEAAQHHQDPATRYAADLLTLAHRRLCTPTETRTGDPQVAPAPWTGVRQTLDALLVVAEDGHAPGTRVREPGTTPHREGTILGADWPTVGPPTSYDIAYDNDPTTHTVAPSEIVVLRAQESDAPPWPYNPHPHRPPPNKPAQICTATPVDEPFARPSATSWDGARTTLSANPVARPSPTPSSPLHRRTGTTPTLALPAARPTPPKAAARPAPPKAETAPASHRRRADQQKQRAGHDDGPKTTTGCPPQQGRGQAPNWAATGRAPQPAAHRNRQGPAPSQHDYRAGTRPAAHRNRQGPAPSQHDYRAGTQAAAHRNRPGSRTGRPAPRPRSHSAETSPDSGRMRTTGWTRPRARTAASEPRTAAGGRA
ncbi:hypothetical protein GCM10018962_44770 [Dactylosporangium matsuzakiense]|uniref:Uncharacterized protein n=1 Tax=Dactylosporangium matsuzakiense TaxID=53360 RepID=A0A9W6KF40_9ACTN|nr:hypothetical protein GCM10017581_014470 [Dactylosporangium matsuzakiense]